MLVTAFLRLPDRRYRLSVEDYLRHGEKLLAIRYPMAIFVEPSLVEFIEERRTHSPTVVYPITLEELELSPAAATMRENIETGTEIRNHRGTGDSPWYSVLCNSKIEFLRRVHEDQKPSRVCWIDFGIYYNYQSTFESTIISFVETPSSTIVIGQMRPLNRSLDLHHRREFHGVKRWTVAAGLFSIPSSMVETIHDRLKDSFKMMLSLGFYLLEEDHLDHLIHCHPEWFSTFRTDHKTLLNDCLDDKTRPF